MPFIADLHLHSKYSRATSRDMEVESLARWGRVKGITLLGTGDFTHPTYFAELKAHLEPAEAGLFRLKKGERSVRFLLSAEVSNVYQEKGRLRKVHTSLFVPSFQIGERLNTALARRGNLLSDGRPTFGFPARDLVRLVLDISPDCLLVPAHAWTPWFSLFGAHSGFDSMIECFGEEAKNIYAIETGLSSDPAMNWRLSALDRITLLSNSDAHSPSKIGREANVFDCPLNYWEIMETIKGKDKKRFLYTIEFFPEEGKYHYDGHRSCGVLFSPAQTRLNRYSCPVCHKRLTVGVMHRVEELADRKDGFVPPDAIPARHLVPLEEIIAAALGQGVRTGAVEEEYKRMVDQGGSEFSILLEMPEEELARFVPPRVLEGILRVRNRKLRITPGYDGIYGKIEIFWDEEEGGKAQPSQMSLF